MNNKCLLLTVAMVIGTVLFSNAAPVWDQEYELRQPDGSHVKVIINGDEFYQDVETPDGYTLIRDPQTQWICYAKLSDDNQNFVSTGITYVSSGSLAKKAQFPAAIGKHLRIASEAALKIRQSRMNELSVNQQVHGGLSKAAVSTVDTVYGVTILVDFQDQKTQVPYDSIVNFLNVEKYTGTRNNGSVRDYFYDISSGKLVYLQKVTAFVTAKNNKSYYDRTDGSGYAGSDELFEEILNTLKSNGTFDFGQATVTGTKKYLRALNFLYAGTADAGWAQGLWPHSGWADFSVNGVVVRNYMMASIGSSLDLGTFCHENGHMLCSWPDLYAYDGHSNGAGSYDLMCGTSGTNPIPPNSYLRSLLGWAMLTEISNDQPGTVYKLPANSDVSYIYSGMSSTSANELFCIEAHTKTGRYATIPDDGLLIWHIDKDGDNTTSGVNDFAVPEQADGKNELENLKNSGGRNDLFEASYKTRFNDTTTPSAVWHNLTKSGIQIANVSAVADTMTFSLGEVTTGVVALQHRNRLLSLDTRTGILRYSLPDGSAESFVRLSLFDLGGRQVYSIVNETCRSGFVYQVDLKQIGRNHGATGKYICKLSDDARVLSSMTIMIQ